MTRYDTATYTKLLTDLLLKQKDQILEKLQIFQYSKNVNKHVLFPVAVQRQYYKSTGYYQELLRIALSDPESERSKEQRDITTQIDSVLSSIVGILDRAHAVVKNEQIDKQEHSVILHAVYNSMNMLTNQNNPIVYLFDYNMLFGMVYEQLTVPGVAREEGKKDGLVQELTYYFVDCVKKTRGWQHGEDREKQRMRLLQTVYEFLLELMQNTHLMIGADMIDQHVIESIQDNFRHHDIPDSYLSACIRVAQVQAAGDLIGLQMFDGFQPLPQTILEYITSLRDQTQNDPQDVVSGDEILKAYVPFLYALLTIESEYDEVRGRVIDSYIIKPVVQKLISDIIASVRVLPKCFVVYLKQKINDQHKQTEDLKEALDKCGMMRMIKKTRQDIETVQKYDVVALERDQFKQVLINTLHMQFHSQNQWNHLQSEYEKLIPEFAIDSVKERLIPVQSDINIFRLVQASNGLEDTLKEQFRDIQDIFAAADIQKGRKYKLKVMSKADPQPLPNPAEKFNDLQRVFYQYLQQRDPRGKLWFDFCKNNPFVTQIAHGVADIRKFKLDYIRSVYQQLLDVEQERSRLKNAEDVKDDDKYEALKKAITTKAFPRPTLMPAIQAVNTEDLQQKLNQFKTQQKTDKIVVVPKRLAGLGKMSSDQYMNPLFRYNNMHGIPKTRLQQRIEQQRMQYAQIQHDTQLLQQDQTKQAAEYKELLKRHAELAEQQKSLLNFQAQVVQQLSNTQTQRQEISSQISHVQQQKDQLKTQIADRKREIDEIKIAIEQVSSLNAIKGQDNDKLILQAQKLAHELNGLKDSLAKLRSIQSDLSADLSTLSGQHQLLKQQLSVLKEQETQISLEVQENQKQIADITERSGLLQSEIDQIASQGDLQTQKSDLEAAINQLTVDIQDVKKAIAKQQTSINDLQTQKQKIESIVLIADRLKQQQQLIQEKGDVEKVLLEYKKLEQDIQLLNDQLQAAGLQPVDQSANPDDVLRALQEREQVLKLQREEEDTRVAEAEIYINALQEAYIQKLRDMIQELGSIKMRYRDVDNALLKKQLEDLRSDMLQLLSEEDRLLVQQMPTDRYDQWISLFAKCKELMLAQKEAIDKELDKNIETKNLLDDLKKIKNEIATITRDINDAESETGHIKKDIQALEREYSDLFQQYGWSSDDIDIAQKVAEKKKELEQQLARRGADLSNMKSKRRRLEESRALLNDLRTAMKDVESISDSDLNAKEATSLQEVERQLDDELKQFMTDFDTKYNFLPPEMRGLGYESEKLNDILQKLKTALFTKKLQRLRDVANRLQTASKIIQAHHSDLDMQIVLKTKESISEQLISVKQQLIDLDQSVNWQPIFLTIDASIEDESSARSLSNDIESIITQKTASIRKETERLKQRVVATLKTVTEILGFILDQTAAVDAIIQAFPNQLNIKEQLIQAQQRVKQYEIPPSVRDGKIVLLFTEFDRMITEILGLMGQFDIQADITKHTKKFAHIIKQYQDKVEQYAMQRDAVNRKYDMLADMVQSVKFTSVDDIERFRKTVKDIHSQIEIRDLLYQTKAWMDSMDLKEMKTTSRSEFEKLVQIDQVILISQDPESQQIKLEVIPYPSATNPFKVVSYNYSRDYRLRLLTKFAQKLREAGDTTGATAVDNYIQTPNKDSALALEFVIKGKLDKFTLIQHQVFYRRIIDYVKLTYPQWLERQFTNTAGQGFSMKSLLAQTGDNLQKTLIESEEFKTVINPMCKNLWLIGMVFNVYYQFNVEWQIAMQLYNKLEAKIQQLNGLLSQKGVKAQKRADMTTRLQSISVSINEYKQLLAQQLSFVIEAFVIPSDYKEQRVPLLQKIEQKVREFIESPDEKKRQEAFERLFPRALTTEQQLEHYNYANDLQVQTGANQLTRISAPFYEKMHEQIGRSKMNEATKKQIIGLDQQIIQGLAKMQPMKPDRYKKTEQDIRDLLKQLPIDVDINAYIAGNLFQPTVEKVRSIDDSIRTIFSVGLAPVTEIITRFQTMQQLIEQCIRELEYEEEDRPVSRDQQFEMQKRPVSVKQTQFTNRHHKTY